VPLNNRKFSVLPAEDSSQKCNVAARSKQQKKAATSPFASRVCREDPRDSGSRDGAAEVRNKSFCDRAASGQDKASMSAGRVQEDRGSKKSPKSTHRNKEARSRQRGMSNHQAAGKRLSGRSQGFQACKCPPASVGTEADPEAKSSSKQTGREHEVSAGP